MVKITISENGKEQVHYTNNFVLSVDADTSNVENLSKLSAVHTDSAPHLLTSVLSVIGGAAEKLGTDIEGMFKILKDTHEFCEGSTMSLSTNENFTGGGNSELN